MNGKAYALLIQTLGHRQRPATVFLKRWLLVERIEK